jgi:hypothetical protein
LQASDKELLVKRASFPFLSPLLHAAIVPEKFFPCRSRRPPM